MALKMADSRGGEKRAQPVHRLVGQSLTEIKITRRTPVQGAQQMRTPRALEGLERICAMIADIGLIDVMWILDQHPRHPISGGMRARI